MTRNFSLVVFGIVGLWAFLVGPTESNGTEARTWKYFGHYFTKFTGPFKVYGLPVISLPAPTPTPQSNFPLSIIPPQALPTVQQPQVPVLPTVIGPPPATIPQVPMLPTVIDPPPGSIPQGPMLPTVIDPTPATIPEVSGLPTVIGPPPGTIQDVSGLPTVIGPPPATVPEVSGLPTVIDSPPASIPGLPTVIDPPPTINDSPSPSGGMTISPDTAQFPAFDLGVSPSPFPTAPPMDIFVAAGSTDVTVGLAQILPVAIPLPQATAQCQCVPAGTCVTLRQGGLVNTRIVTQNSAVVCAAGQQYCCSQFTNLPQQTSCGIPNVVAGVTPAIGQANFGEFPWSGIILNAADQYIGGAALIDSTHLLTAAHLVAPYGNGAGLKVRLGEWDLTGTYESSPFTDIAVLQIVTHPSYVSSTLQNDLAIITLATPATLLATPTPQVNTVCLPAATDVFTGMGCHVAGWGRDAWGGNYQNIIKKVDVPVMGSVDCQARLRQTKLGPAWNLDTNSFICAGGELSKDACQGDGGNALVCLQNGRYVVAGITAGGVECGRAGVPGLYVNVVNYLTWIQTNIQATLPTPTVAPTAGSLDPRRG